MSERKSLHILTVLSSHQESMQLKASLEEGMRDVDLVVEPVFEGLQGLEKLTQSDFDICLLDSHLPDMEGLHFLRLLEAREITTPVIFLTEEEDIKMAPDALRAGARNHLLKHDLSPHLLSVSIHYVLELERNEMLRKQAEHDILKVQKRNQQLVESISSILIGIRHDGTITYWNHVAERTFGLPAAAVLNRPLRDCGLDWDYERIKAAVQECLERNRPVRMDDVVLNQPMGQRSIFGFTVNPLTEALGDVEEVFILGADITERRKATEKLKAYTQELELANARINQAKAKDEAILASVGDGLVVTDERGRIILVNKQAEMMFGWEASEAVGAPLLDQIPIETDKGVEITGEEHPVFNALKSGNMVKLTANYVVRVKQPLPLQITASPVILDGRIVGAIGIFRDITREKEIDRTKTEFVSTVSHELRTPLTSIREGVAQVFEELLGPVNDDQKEFLHIALDEVDRLAAIINDLLDISKIEAGKIVLKKTWGDIRELVEEVEAGYQLLMKNKKLTLETDLPPDPVELHCDQDKIKQVITNLLTNAYKFTEEGGQITIRVEDKGNLVDVSIQDTGIGISEENIPKLFDKFVQVGRTAGPGIKGTGLGLSISKNLVEMHEGTIRLTSRQGEGSCFSFTLPKMRRDLAAHQQIETGLQSIRDESMVLSILILKLDIVQPDVKKKDRIKPQLILKEFIKKAEIAILRGSGDIFLNGAEECVVILPGCDREKGERIGEKMKTELLSMLEKREDSGQISYSVEVGRSTYPEDADTSESLLSRARIAVKAVWAGLDRRSSARAAYEMTLKMTPEHGQPVSATSLDISEGGLRLHGSQPFNVGTVSEVCLDLPKGFGMIKSKAVVVWVKKNEEKDEYVMGMKFVGMTAAHRNKIKKFVNAEIRCRESSMDAGREKIRKSA